MFTIDHSYTSLPFPHLRIKKGQRPPKKEKEKEKEKKQCCNEGHTH
jgi:hypothetical protein